MVKEFTTIFIELTSFASSEVRSWVNVEIFILAFLAKLVQYEVQLTNLSNVNIVVDLIPGDRIYNCRY